MCLGIQFAMMLGVDINKGSARKNLWANQGIELEDEEMVEEDLMKVGEAKSRRELIVYQVCGKILLERSLTNINNYDVEMKQ